MTEKEAEQFNPVTLAFLGDAVFSLLVRDTLVKKENAKPSSLALCAGSAVSAHAQATFAKGVFDFLTEEEKNVFLRGRNAKKPTKSKNADIGEYAAATGVEAVFGFLFLQGKKERIEELFSFFPSEFLALKERAKGWKP